MLGQITEACKNTSSILLTDECFLDFVCGGEKYSAKPLTAEYKNIVILKAFTKIFAMPGLRLGYAICGNKKLTDRMKFCGADWAVSNIAQEAGIAALKDGGKYIETTRGYVKNQRGYLNAELKNLGLTVYPSHANFIFFHCARNIDLYAELHRKNIIIRNCANFKGLTADYYRIAVLTEEKNKSLIKALNEIYHKM
jgi:histidinol-phosphate/aromatic aminotransferase/cobyric acid decarboxylase-like protein